MSPIALPKIEEIQRARQEVSEMAQQNNRQKMSCQTLLTLSKVDAYAYLNLLIPVNQRNEKMFDRLTSIAYRNYITLDPKSLENAVEFQNNVLILATKLTLTLFIQRQQELISRKAERMKQIQALEQLVIRNFQG